MSTTGENILSALPPPDSDVIRWDVNRQRNQTNALDDSGLTRTGVVPGRFSIKGSCLKFPEREFTVKRTDNNIIFETAPHARWPHITIAASGEIDEDGSIGGPYIVDLILEPGANTASAEIFYYVTDIDLARAGHWKLELADIPILEMTGA